MKTFDVSFKDTIQAESEDTAYSVLLKYLGECVGFGDVTAFDFKEHKPESDTLPEAVNKCRLCVEAYAMSFECYIRQYGNGIAFTPDGLARAMAINGWIWGCYQAGGDAREVAASVAEHWWKALEYNAKYGGLADGTDMPAFITELSDDGCKHSFRFLCFAYAGETDEPESDSHKVRIIRRGFKNHLYKFSHNGGLIYHGPGAGQTFTVRLTSEGNYWGRHT